MSTAEQVKLDNFSSVFSVEGKVAVVTGGSRGLGLHAASGYVLLFSLSKAPTNPSCWRIVYFKPDAPRCTSLPARKPPAMKPLLL